MKLKPILFNTAMVRSLLKGYKNQTRREVKFPSGIKNPKFKGVSYQNRLYDSGLEENPNSLSTVAFFSYSNGEISIKPKYEVNDILWVRETCLWVMKDHASDLLEGQEKTQWVYRADQHDDNWMDYAREKYNYKWTPSIFAPFDSARLFYRVTSVSVEKLQDISEIDALNEGLPIRTSATPPHDLLFQDPSTLNIYPKATQAFESLWKSINGKANWKKNPYVWVYRFERIEEPEV